MFRCSWCGRRLNLGSAKLPLFVLAHRVRLFYISTVNRVQRHTPSALTLIHLFDVENRIFHLFALIYSFVHSHIVCVCLSRRLSCNWLGVGARACKRNRNANAHIAICIGWAREREGDGEQLRIFILLTCWAGVFLLHFYFLFFCVLFAVHTQRERDEIQRSLTNGHFSRFYNSTFNTFSRRNHIQPSSIDLQRLTGFLDNANTHITYSFAQSHRKVDERRRK